MELKYKTTKEDENRTVMHILKHRLKISSTLVKRLKRSGGIYLNGITAITTTPVSAGDEITAVVSFVECSPGVLPEDLPLNIVYEDNCLIALNKPPDTVIHPTSGQYTGTLANALAGYLDRKGIKRRIRPVSRLDRDTSGVVIFALNAHVQYILCGQMKNGTMNKEYLGIVLGHPRPDFGVIDLPVARLPGSSIQRHVSKDGRRSVTHYRVLEKMDNCSFVKFMLETGRTHQIRVHCEAIGHPILGDTLYGNAEFPAYCSRQMLHSASITALHPQNGSNLKLCASIPADMKKVINYLKNKATFN